MLCERSDQFRPFSSLSAQDTVDSTTVNKFSVLDLLQMEMMVKSLYFTYFYGVMETPDILLLVSRLRKNVL